MTATPDPSLEPGEAPLLSVTRGNPTAEELAAVTAVVLALQSGNGGAEKAKPPIRQWVRRAQLHLPPKPGAGSWRRSGR